MKKIVLSAAAIVMLGAFVGGCATPKPAEPAPKVIRKG